MILQYEDFFKSFDNFIQIRPDLMLEIIKHDFFDYRIDKNLKDTILDNFFVLRYSHTSFVDITEFLSFAEKHTIVKVYHIYNNVTYDYQLLASVLKLDINSDHYTNEDNSIKELTNRELTKFLNQRK